MAVTLVVSDCKQPKGELMDSFFPEADIDSLITGWLAQAVTKVTSLTDTANDAALAWVYYRAYQHISLRMESDFASKNISSGAGNATIARTQDQRKFFMDKEQYWFSLFNSYGTVAATEPAIPAFFGIVSVSRGWQ